MCEWIRRWGGFVPVRGYLYFKPLFVCLFQPAFAFFAEELSGRRGTVRAKLTPRTYNVDSMRHCNKSSVPSAWMWSWILLRSACVTWNNKTRGSQRMFTLRVDWRCARGGPMLCIKSQVCLMYQGVGKSTITGPVVHAGCVSLTFRTTFFFFFFFNAGMAVSPRPEKKKQTNTFFPSYSQSSLPS